MAARRLGYGLFLGELPRPHLDIDWFTWDRNETRLQEALVNEGYALSPGPPRRGQFDIARSDVELSFALISQDERGRVVVADGLWAGEPWPDDMLDGQMGELRGIRCPIISPRAQIEIKEMMPIWVPGRPRRAKDAADITRLKAALMRA